MLASARKSGDAALLRYLVKKLGLVSDVGKIRDADNLVVAAGDSLGFLHDAAPLPQDVLAKLECARCEAVCATLRCGGCGVARYCSKMCSRSHWKSGGHRNDCKVLQGRA